MELITRSEFESLVSRREPGSASIYLPAHRSGWDTQQDPIRFKNLIQRAQDLLIQQSIRPTDSISRYGPTDILLLLTHTNMEQAKGFLARIKREITEQASQIVRVRPEPDVSFAIRLGMAEAQAGSDLASMLDLAESGQETICEYRTKP